MSDTEKTGNETAELKKDSSSWFHLLEMQDPNLELERFINFPLHGLTEEQIFD